MPSHPSPYTLTLTIALCLLTECFWLALFWAKEGSFLTGLFYSVVVWGPLSAWLAPPLYRYIRKSSS